MPSVGDDIRSSVGIVRNTFCGQCGYNLYTRPIIGRCPECGCEYDARPQAMRGIFLPRDIRFPFEPLMFGLCSGALGGPTLYAAAEHGGIGAVLIGVVFSTFALLFFWGAGRKTATYVRYRKLARHVGRGEDGDS